VLEVPEVRIKRVRGRGPRLRHLDGLERVEPLPRAIPVRFGILQGELHSVLTVPRPRDRSHLALLYYPQILAGPAIEAVPSGLRPWPRPRRPRPRDAPHAGERDRSLAFDQETWGRRDAHLRRE